MLTGKLTRQLDLSPSHEHYLRAIWEVRTRRGYARLIDVARELEISPPTLSVGLRSLETRGLVQHDEHRFLLLTEEGERIARQVHHRFTVMRVFLAEVLGVPKHQADTEACRLEHDVSGSTAERVLDLLKLLHEDEELRQLLASRLASYRRSCRSSAECSTCDLACMEPVTAR